MTTSSEQPYRQQLAEALQKGRAGWEEFWFRPADPLLPSLMRVLTGWMLVYNLLVWGTDLQAFFGHHGLVPLHAIEELYRGEPVFSLFFDVPEGWLWPVHWCCVCVAVLFFVGFATRLTSIAAFLITISYSQRVPVANFGLDQVLGLMCLYLAIGPCGDCLSFDALIRRRRSNELGEPFRVAKSSTARISLRLIQLHLCVIYFWAGFSKLKGTTWWTGEAMWSAIANQEYQTIDLTWLAWVPWVPFLIAHVTIAWEVFFCVLVWNRLLRPIMLFMGAMMHIGIGAFFGMWTFGLIMTFAYLSYGNETKWRRRITRALKRLELPEPILITGTNLMTSTAANAALPEPTISRSRLDQPHSDFSRSSSTAPSSLPLTTPSTVASMDASSATPIAASKDVSAGDTVAPEAEQYAPPVSGKSPQHATSYSLTERPAETATDAGSVASSDDTHEADDGAAPQLPLSSIGLSGTGVMVVSLQTAERNTLRQYFRLYDIPCRAVSSAENALSIATQQKPCAVIVSGILMSSDELATLVEDLVDLSEFPVIALLSPLQHRRLAHLSQVARVLHYPTSPENIRAALQSVMFGEVNRDTDPNAAPAGNQPWQALLGRPSGDSPQS